MLFSNKGIFCEIIILLADKLTISLIFKQKEL